ncbi:MAG: hypothetical protein QW457_03030 [Candidatus Bathyarchaeia archaeon]
MILVVDSPGAAFFMRDLRRCHAKYIKCGVDEMPTFIISNDERLLLFLEQKPYGERETDKPATLYTNCTVLVKALNKIFRSAWESSYLKINLFALKQHSIHLNFKNNDRFYMFF